METLALVQRPAQSAPIVLVVHRLQLALRVTRVAMVTRRRRRPRPALVRAQQAISAFLARKRVMVTLILVQRPAQSAPIVLVVHRLQRALRATRDATVTRRRRRFHPAWARARQAISAFLARKRVMETLVLVQRPAQSAFIVRPARTRRHATVRAPRLPGNTATWVQHMRPARTVRPASTAYLGQRQLPAMEHALRMRANIALRGQLATPVSRALRARRALAPVPHPSHAQALLAPTALPRQLTTRAWRAPLAAIALARTQTRVRDVGFAVSFRVLVCRLCYTVTSCCLTRCSLGWFAGM
jgi:hypothetical protein